MERNLAFERDAEAFRKDWLAKEQELSQKIAHARELVDQVTHTSRDLLSIAALTASLNVDGHRADLVILKAARAAGRLRRPHPRSTITTLPWRPSWRCRTASSARPSSRPR